MKFGQKYKCFQCVITTKGASTEYWLEGGEY